jgi:hypothetical protein
MDEACRGVEKIVGRRHSYLYAALCELGMETTGRILVFDKVKTTKRGVCGE